MNVILFAFATVNQIGKSQFFKLQFLYSIAICKVTQVLSLIIIILLVFHDFCPLLQANKVDQTLKTLIIMNSVRF